MFLDILLLFQHAAGACTGCMLCWFMWLLLPFLLGLGIGYWIWGKYKELIASKDREIDGIKKQLTTMEKDYMDLKYKMEQADKDNSKLRRSLADCQSTRSSLSRKLEIAESVVKEVPTEKLGIVETSVEEVVEETVVEEAVEEIQEETIVEDTPTVEAAAPLAVVGAATAIAATADATPTEVPASVDKEDDYLSCKEYEGHRVNDKKNNIAFFKHSNGQYYFVLYNKDGSVKLRSEGFPSAKLRDKELSGVIRFNNQPSQYKRVSRGKYFMDVLYDDKGTEVGRSCLQRVPAAPVVEEVKETPSVVAATAPLATVAATSSIARKSIKEIDDKEDDYLTCKEYIGHTVNDKRNNIALFKHSNGQYYFVLYSANGAVRLRSEGFRTSEERDKELSGVIRFKNQVDKYKRLQKGKYYMDALYDDKGREVGRSCLQKMPEPEPEAIVEEEKITTSFAIETPEPEVVERQIIKVKRTVNISGLEDLDGMDAASQSKLRGLGLGSMTALAAADEASLAAHFKGTNSNWKYWWNQAKYATSGDWANYYGYQANKGQDTATSTTSQQFISSTTPTLSITGDEIPTSPEPLTGPEVIENPPAPPSTDITTSVPNITAPDVNLTASETSTYSNYFATSNLQIVEGVGPKLEVILKKAGYTSWANLASANYEDLKKMLSNAGPRYRIHDPKSWSRQAQLASENKWQELIDYQKYLSSSSSTVVSYSKVEKLMDRNLGFTNSSPTDLKIVEGVGPKIEGLLKAGGIYNWTDLSNASVDKLKLILQNAGSRYRLADPSTWPTQAGMAVRKEWTKLKEYQDLLQGGKKIS